MRIACLQLGPRGEQPARERVAHVAALVAGLEEVDLVVLPELWPTDFFRFDRYEREAEPLNGPTVTSIREAARNARSHVAGGSFVERTDAGRLHNTAFLAGPEGELLLVYRKVHTFGYRSSEASLLDPGEELRTAPTTHGRVGLATCYDLRFPELFRLLADAGSELVVVPAAWPAARGEHWRLLTRARALENQVMLVACAARGSDSGTPLAGTSAVVGPWGEPIAEAGPDDAMLAAEVDPECVSEVRAEFPVLADRRLHVAGIGSQSGEGFPEAS